LTASGKVFPERDTLLDIGKCIVEHSVRAKALPERQEAFVRREECKVSWIYHAHRLVPFHQAKTPTCRRGNTGLHSITKTAWG